MINEKHIGSTFDDFLEEEGIQEQSTVMALKRVIAWQIEHAMQEENLNKTDLAKRMDTSRSAVDRLLDPHNFSINLQTMVKAAGALGKKLEIQFN